MEQAEKKSSALLIAAAWLLVLVPTVWGLTFTVGSAMKLFSAPGSTVSAPVSVSPAAK